MENTSHYPTARGYHNPGPGPYATVMDYRAPVLDHEALGRVLERAGRQVAQSMAGISAAAREALQALTRGGTPKHIWHIHLELGRSRGTARDRVRVLRIVGAGHRELKHARDLMRQEEKAEARRYRGGSGLIRTGRS